MGTQPYNFVIDSFTIRNTRSLHVDTDFVSASIAVGSSPAWTQTKAMGDLNNGTFHPGIAFNSFSVDDADTVVFSYAIVNNGHSDPTTVEKALQQAVGTLASKGAQAAATAIGSGIGAAIGSAIGTAAVPIIGTALGALAGWLVSEAGAILFANCDGPVAAGVHVYTGAQLRAATAQGAAVQASDRSPGTNSATGCGSNSDYEVAWSIRPYTDLTDQTGFVRFGNVWKTDQFINIEGGAPASGPVGPGWLSAQWQQDLRPSLFGDPAGAKVYWLRNRWKPDEYLNIEGGKLQSTPIQPGWLSARWTFAPVAGTNAFQIKNVWQPALCLNIESGALSAGAILPGWLSARWIVQPV